MDLLGTTFAGYEAHQLVMRTALLSLYHATRPVPQSRQGTAGPPRAQPVALWVSDPLDHRASPVIRDFLRRAELSASIDHPAIAPVLDLGEAEGRIYFVTAAGGAGTLGEVIRRTGPLPPDGAVEMLSGVADGLDVAHAKGLTHGAISPATIWVERTEDGMRSHLTGFGIEALLRARARGDLRDTLLDDVVYIAPEQLRSDDGSTDESDQYALACALYHCVAGAPPFVRDRTSALFGAHMLARPAPPMSGDSAVDDAVLTGMAKDPEQRFRSCVHLLEAAVGHPLPRTLPESGGDHLHAGGWGQEDDEREHALTWGPRSEDRHERDGGRPTPGASTGSRDEDLTTVPASATAPRPDAGAAPDAATPRRRPGGAWMAWVAAGLVLLVVVGGAAAAFTGLLARDSDEPEDVAQQPVRDTTTSRSEPGAVVAWQREIGREPVTHLAVEELNAVAATGNNLTVVNPLTGSRRWRKVADVGILTDLVAVGDVLVYRTDVLSGISLPYGIQLWESDDVAPAPGGLSSGSSEVFAMSIGRALPELAAVDPRTGAERWHFHGQNVLVDNDAAVGAGGDRVVVLQRRALIGVDPRRRPVVTEGGEHAEIVDEAWRRQIANPWIETLATSPTEAVFALQNGSVCAYALTDGEKQWCVQVGGVRDGAPALLVRNETVVVVSPDEMVALDLSSGQERWQVEAEEPYVPLVTADSGLVYTADTEGTVHAHSLTDGAPQWGAGGLADITALAGAEGGVLLGTEDGVLARIEPTGG